MSSHYYEVALFGEFYPKDLKAILNRTALHSESSQPMHCREVVFEPIDAVFQRESGTDPVLLRARKELLEKDAGWILYSYLKPESVRVHPEATVRPWATTQVIGDALSFASALGYVRRSQIYKRGYVFRRGGLVIQMFQQEQARAALVLTAFRGVLQHADCFRPRPPPHPPRRFRCRRASIAAAVNLYASCPDLVHPHARSRAPAGRPAHREAHPCARGHTLGGRGEDGRPDPEHAGDAAQRRGRRRARRAAAHEGPPRSPATGPLTIGPPRARARPCPSRGRAPELLAQRPIGRADGSRSNAEGVPAHAIAISGPAMHAPTCVGQSRISLGVVELRPAREQRLGGGRP